MAAVAFLVLMVFASLGAGSLMLAGTRTCDGANVGERVVLSFVLGVGGLGWLLFFPALIGHIGKWELAAIFLLFSISLFAVRPALSFSKPKLDPIQLLLLGGLAIVFAVDLLEGLAPPADADSLAYHFALPKDFLRQGELFPVYRAVDGAVPLLMQMTYLGALGTGGELTLTLWTMTTGWASTGLLYVIARRHISTRWSLAAALMFATTPAVIYGAGTGQVEVRNAAFVLAAAWAASEARRTGTLRFAVLAGCAAGFFAASKYTGLIFAFACGCMIILQKRWLASGLAYSAAVLVVSNQWYLWNAWNTGDPIFPLLYGVVSYTEGANWNDGLANIYKHSLGDRTSSPSLAWLFRYPIDATLFAKREYESLRVGLGPFGLLVFPIAVTGLWRFRNRILNHPLFAFGGMFVIFYVIWFFAMPSLRIRHLLPMYPLALISLLVPAIRLADRARGVTLPLLGVVKLTLALQLMGSAIFTIKYVQYFARGESREMFLRRNVSHFDAVLEVAKTVPDTARLLVITRQLIYHFSVPVFYAHENFQGVVETHPHADDPVRLWRQLQSQKITHLLVQSAELPVGVPKGFPALVNLLREKSCLTFIKTFDVLHIKSRTLPTLKKNTRTYSIVRLTPNTCQINPSPRPIN